MGSLAGVRPTARTWGSSVGCIAGLGTVTELDEVNDDEHAVEGSETMMGISKTRREYTKGAARRTITER